MPGRGGAGDRGPSQQLGEGIGVALCDGAQVGPAIGSSVAGRRAAAAGKAARRSAQRRAGPGRRSCRRRAAGPRAPAARSGAPPRLPRSPRHPGRDAGAGPVGPAPWDRAARRARRGTPLPGRRPRSSSEAGRAASVSQATAACSAVMSPSANAAAQQLPTAGSGNLVGVVDERAGRVVVQCPGRGHHPAGGARVDAQAGAQPAGRRVRAGIGRRARARRSRGPARAAPRRPGTSARCTVAAASRSSGPDIVHSSPSAPGTDCATASSRAARMPSSAAVTGWVTGGSRTSDMTSTYWPPRTEPLCQPVPESLCPQGIPGRSDYWIGEPAAHPVGGTPTQPVRRRCGAG